MKKEYLTARVTSDLKEFIQNEAEKQRRTVSWITAELLADAIEAYKNKQNEGEKN